MGLTKFGVFLRKLRLEKAMVLRKMANDLEISPAYLSVIENGKRAIPASLPQKIIQLYSLSSKETEELCRSVDLSQTQVTVNTQGDALSNKIILALSRKMTVLSNEQKERILEIIS